MISSLRRIALSAVLAGAFSFSATAATITITVDDPADYVFGATLSNDPLVDGTGCTLRKAMFNIANGAQTYTDCVGGSANPADDHEIKFNAPMTIQIGTMGDPPDVTKKIKVTGPGTTINGNTTGLGTCYIFRITTGGELTLEGNLAPNNLTLGTAGKAAVRIESGGTSLSANNVTFSGNETTNCCGGAIMASPGLISLANVNFTSNKVTSANGQGGAIYLTGGDASTITNATFTLNTAAESGGAIYVSLNSSLLPPATLTVINAIFTSNTASGASGTMGGGAIYASAGGTSFVSLLNNQFILNKADGNDGRGGAIHNGKHDVQMIVDHAIFGTPVPLTGNSANANAGSMGGAIYTVDNILVRASSFIGNDAGPGKGGAIASDVSAPSGGELGAIIANSTISGNTAAEGAAIYSFGASGTRELRLHNVTIDGNTATAAAGGIRTENVGGGTGLTYLRNTIVSNNKVGGVDDNCSHVGLGSDPVVNVVGNLQFPGATCLADVPITTGDPKLNGVFVNPPDVLTFTMSLQAGSAASNTGDNTTCTDPTYFVLSIDQRLMIRPQGGPNCDIGAYESSIAPGYGSVPGPGSTITINTFTGVPATSNLVISETGDDHLTINSYGFAGSAEITISGLPAFPFNINDGTASQTNTFTCSSPSPVLGLTGTFTVSHNATGSPATYTVNCNVVDPLVITTATPLASHTVNVAGYSQTLAATGGTAPYGNWIVTIPALPTGLSLDPVTGAITGTPTAVGTFNFTVQVSDSAAVPLTTTKAFSITINAAPVPPTITTATPLPGGITGTPYPLLTFAATGGTPPYTNWAVTLGTLPTGLTLNPGTGDLTGTPTVAGPYSFSITVTDSTPLTNTKAFTMTVIDPPSITTATPLPPGEATIPYVPLTFAATAGTPPYGAWQVILGSLPPGLTLAPGTGQLTGTPNTAGPYSFTIQTTDATPLNASKAFTMTINPLPTISTATPLPGGTVSTPYNLTFAATGGTLPYTNWAVTLGTLPTGLTLNPGTGALTGTPSVAAPNSFSITVTDSLGGTNTKAFTLLISAAPVPPTITTPSPLPAGTAGTAYVGVTFAASGGTPPYTNWAVTLGALPTGLALNPGTGALTGTPTVAGPYSFSITVTDSTPLTNTKAFTLLVNPPSPTITTATPLPTGTQGTPYLGVTFAATGGTPPYTNWAVTLGALPTGLTLNPGTGALTGTPTVAGPYSFSITVTDSGPATATKAFTVTINPPGAPTITTATPLPAGTVSTAYVGVTFAATGGTPPYTNWAVTVGTLPTGLTLNPTTGALTGTPSVAGPYSFTIQVTDSTPLTATKAFTLTVNAAAAPTITTASPLPGGTVGTAYNQTFAATGGTPPYSNWIVTVGTLPAGLTLNPTTGALTGTPSAAGTSNFTVQVQDSVAATTTKAFALTIAGGPLSITTATPLPGGTVGTAYSLTFAAAGGTAPYVNWVVTVGTLPPGLSLAATTGALTGTPSTATGSPFSFTVQVTDSVAGTATKAFTLAVAAPGCFTGPSTSGNATACVAGGGPTCTFAPGTAQFIPLTGHPSSPPAGTAPSGILFPQGLFTFTLNGCTPGATVTMTVTYPSAIDPASQYWKYGPRPASPPPSWYILPATIGANTVTFSVVDGGLGDDDLLANGTIVDQGGPGVPGGGGPSSQQTPTLSEWALILLATLILLIGLGRGGFAGRRRS